GSPDCFTSRSANAAPDTHPNSDKLTGKIPHRLYRGIWLIRGPIRTSQPHPRARREPMLMETLMKTTLTALVAAAVIATATAAAPTQADARCFGCAVGAGVVGGLVAGAIIGSAVANSRPAYVVAPGPGYVAYPAYAAALPGPNCYWTRMPVYDAFGNVVGW